MCWLPQLTRSPSFSWVSSLLTHTQYACLTQDDKRQRKSKKKKGFEEKQKKEMEAEEKISEEEEEEINEPAEVTFQHEPSPLQSAGYVTLVRILVCCEELDFSCTGFESAVLACVMERTCWLAVLSVLTVMR